MVLPASARNGTGLTYFKTASTTPFYGSTPDGPPHASASAGPSYPPTSAGPPATASYPLVSLALVGMHDDLNEFEKTINWKNKLENQQTLNTWRMRVRCRVFERCWIMESLEAKAAVRNRVEVEREAAKALPLEVEETRGLSNDAEKRAE